MNDCNHRGAKGEIPLAPQPEFAGHGVNVIRQGLGRDCVSSQQGWGRFGDGIQDELSSCSIGKARLLWGANS